MKDLGTFIETRRIAAGYASQTALAEAMGKGSSWVSRLERGAAKELPSPEDVALLSRFLGVSSAEIIAAAGYDVSTGREDDSPAISALRPVLDSYDGDVEQLVRVIQGITRLK